MLLHIPNVLTPQQVQRCCALLNAAEWIDGRATAGYQGASVKNNAQLAEDSALAQQLGNLILVQLERNPLFISATLPARVYPPMFNRYVEGANFGSHVDNAVRLLPGSGVKLRTDISATLFLSESDSYDGGELLIEDTYGTQSVKLSAGHMVIYPSTSLHRVEPVGRGVRIAAFFWVQSMVRAAAQRALLFDMDTAIQRLRQTGGDEPAVTQLTGNYHNLLRMWAETSD
jgi:PKHD-type hydroxylase